MLKMRALLLISIILLPACASQPTVPVAVSCPPPPPLPTVLTLRASTELSLSKRLEASLDRFAVSLKQATRQP